MNSLEEFINEISEEMNEDSVKENPTVKEATKPVVKTEEGIKDKEEIFPKKVKSKFVATKPALWEQNVQNLKNKNLKKK